LVDCLQASTSTPPDIAHTLGQTDSSVEGAPCYSSLVSARLSPWLSCDTDDERLTRLSIREMLREINYCAYLGCLVVQYDVPDLHKCTNLVQTLRYWLDRSVVKPVVWLVVDVHKVHDFVEYMI